MANYFSIPNKFNRLLLIILSIAPFAAYISLVYLNMDFLTTFTLLSYFGVFFVLFYSSKKNPIKFPKYLFFYLLFIIYIFYSTFYILDRDFKMKYLVSYRLIGGLNLLFIIENIIFSKKFFNKIIKISKVVLFIAIAVIIIQQTIDINFFVRQDLVTEFASDSGNEDRLDSIYSWISLNSIGFSFVPIFLIIAEIFVKKKSKILLFWVVFGVSFALLTKARWVMVNILLVFLLLIVNKREKIKQSLKYILIVPFILIASFFVLSAVGMDVEGMVKERILESDKKDISQKSAGTRLLAFKVFNKLYWKNAVFGVGDIKYGMGGTDKHNYELERALAGRSSQIHVGYLSLFYIYGIIGAFFIFSLFISFNEKIIH